MNVACGAGPADDGEARRAMRTISAIIVAATSGGRERCIRTSAMSERRSIGIRCRSLGWLYSSMGCEQRQAVDCREACGRSRKEASMCCSGGTHHSTGWRAYAGLPPEIVLLGLLA